MDESVPTVVAARLGALGGVAGMHDLMSCGADHAQVHRWVRSGRLRRVRSGAYVDRAVWESADRGGRRRLEAMAMLRARTGASVDAGRGITLGGSGHTALACYGLPVIDDNPTLVLARVGGGRPFGNPRAVVESSWGDRSIVVRSHVAVARPEIAIISHTIRAGLDEGIVACDAALHAALVTVDSMEQSVVALARRPGIRAVRAALRLVDGRSESPGETLARLALVGAGVPVRSQEWITTDKGRFRVDLLVDRVIVEFDGAVKYGGVQGRDALVAEKRREDALRRAGFAVVRVVWADLFVAGRVMRLVEEARRAVGRRISG